MEEACYILLEFRNWYQAKPSEYEPFLNEKISVIGMKTMKNVR